MFNTISNSDQLHVIEFFVPPVGRLSGRPHAVYTQTGRGWSKVNTLRSPASQLVSNATTGLRRFAFKKLASSPSIWLLRVCCLLHLSISSSLCKNLVLIAYVPPNPRTWISTSGEPSHVLKWLVDFRVFTTECECVLYRRPQRFNCLAIFLLDPWLDPPALLTRRVRLTLNTGVTDVVHSF